jgi:hypothetical protein
MTSKEKLDQAVRLLKEINCPEEILDALWYFGLTVNQDETKLKNWQALAGPGMVEGTAREINEEEK